MAYGLLSPGQHERIVVTTDAVGGVWQYSVDLATGLVRRGVEIVLLVMGPVRAPFHPPGVRTLDTGLALDWTATDERELDDVAAFLRGFARDEGATSVHLHAPGLVGHVRWFCPFVVVAHSCVATWWAAVKGGPLPPELEWRRERTHRGLLAADAIVVPSHAFGAQLAGCYGLDRAKHPVTVIHNGRAPGPVGERAPGHHVLTAGRLWDEAKDADVLDRAAARVTIRAAGAAEGPDAARRFGNLVLLGQLSDDELARERARAGAFVSMSRYEPFGLSVLEAAQSGLPLVLSDVPTFRELWDGVAEFVPPGDGAALELALCRVLAEPRDRGLRAWARSARYSVDVMVDRTLALHREVATKDSWMFI